MENINFVQCILLADGGEVNQGNKLLSKPKVGLIFLCAMRSKLKSKKKVHFS